ncbi:MAG: sugar phosphate nucleotidyltransferase [Thermoplasmatota archaeon]
MDVVVMAAGRGTRLLPLTLSRPKPMIPFFNTPLIDYILYGVSRLNVDRVFMLVDYMQEQMMRHCGDGSKYGLHIGYYTNNEPFGTAGACNKVVRELSSPFLVVSGDIVTNLDLGGLISFHESRGGEATIALSRVENPSQYGVALLDEEKRVRRFLEKPSREEAFSNTVNAGVYVLEKEVFREVPPGANLDFSKHLFPRLLERGSALYGYEFQDYWNDIGLPSTYLAASEDAIKGKLRLRTIHPRGAPFSNGERALITGRNCAIHGSIHVEGFAILGDGVEVGKNVEMSRSIIWSGSRIGDSVRLKETIIGEGCEIGSGTVLDTGCVAGDRCTVGEDCRIGTNIKLWYGSRLGPGTVMIPDQ